MRHYCPTLYLFLCVQIRYTVNQPNKLPLIEKGTRWEIDPTHPYQNGS